MYIYHEKVTYQMDDNVLFIVLWLDELWIVTDVVVVCAVKTLAGDLLRALENFEM